jgi:F0F1-type ATP synthase membrane subunit a
MIPFGIALTSHIILIFALSFTISISFFIIGFLNHGIAFLKLFIPECPFFLLFLLVPIEIFSYAIRALSLAIRLSANIMAGHTLLFICAGFVMKLSKFKV